MFRELLIPTLAAPMSLPAAGGAMAAGEGPYAGLRGGASVLNDSAVTAPANDDFPALDVTSRSDTGFAVSGADSLSPNRVAGDGAGVSHVPPAPVRAFSARPERAPRAARPGPGSIPPGRAPRWLLTRIRRREPGCGGIGQATYAAQSAIRTRRRSNKSLRR